MQHRGGFTQQTRRESMSLGRCLMSKHDKSQKDKKRNNNRHTLLYRIVKLYLKLMCVLKRLNKLVHQPSRFFKNTTLSSLFHSFFLSSFLSFFLFFIFFYLLSHLPIQNKLYLSHISKCKNIEGEGDNSLNISFLNCKYKILSIKKQY